MCNTACWEQCRGKARLVQASIVQILGNTCGSGVYCGAIENVKTQGGAPLHTRLFSSLQTLNHICAGHAQEGD